jgi:hypothetical protein
MVMFPYHFCISFNGVFGYLLTMHSDGLGLGNPRYAAV